LADIVDSKRQGLGKHGSLTSIYVGVAILTLPRLGLN